MEARKVPGELQAVAEWLRATAAAMVADHPDTTVLVDFADPFGDAVLRLRVTAPQSRAVLGKAGVNAEALRRLARAIARAQGYDGRLDVHVADLRA